MSAPVGQQGQQTADATVEAVQTQASGLGLSWALRVGTVLFGSDPAAVILRMDGDNLARVNGFSMVGPLPVGMRVYVVEVPPAGQYVVGFAGGHIGYIYAQTVMFVASGTFTKTDYPDLRAVIVEVVGGGGAGAGAAATGAGQVSAGSGGSGADYARAFLLESALATNETVTVGAGGIGAAGAVGGDGGDGSFGALCIAGGGRGGDVVLAAGATARCGNGVNPSSTAAVGDWAFRGQGSGGPTCIEAQGAMGGYGGGSHLGGGARSMGITTGGTNGTAGASYGGGGSGAANGPSLAAKTGGNGGPGLILVHILI